MSSTYADGVADGLRMAAQILAELEQAVEVKLDHGSKSTKTRDTRRTRATAYRVAGARITTRLKARRGRGVGNTDGIAKNLARLGL